MKKRILFCLVLLAGYSTFAQEKQAEISFDHTRHDFGTFKEGDYLSHIFTFVNTGNAPLILSTVNSSCSCVLPSWSKEPIMPGDSAKITILYYSIGRGIGSFIKHITVLSNAKTEMVTLIITGTAIARVEDSTPEKTK